MTIIGRQVGPKAYSFQLADPLVTDHEFAHAMEDHLPGGPSVFAARWREAQAADAFRGLAFESHREPGVDVLVGDLWVAGPAKKVKRVSEDWAEAYSLLRREQRGTPLISSQPERRFDQVYPSRAKLLAEVLRSTPWFPPAG